MLHALEKFEKGIEKRMRSNSISLHRPSVKINKYNVTRRKLSLVEEPFPKSFEFPRKLSVGSAASSIDGLPKQKFIVVRKNSLPSDVSSSNSGSSLGTLIGADFAERWIPSSSSSSCAYDDDDASLLAIPVDNPDLCYAQFLQTHSCYDAMPQSNKLLVFDTQLPIRKAFLALAESHCNNGLLYNSMTNQMVGLMSVTDFMRLLLRFYTIWKDRETFESGCDGLIQNPIAQSLDILERDKVFRHFTPIDSTESLLSGAKKLSQVPFHHLPVIDPTGDPLFILTDGQILHFMYNGALKLPEPSFMRETPELLNVGAWNHDLHIINPETPLLESIQLLFQCRLGALPIVSNGRVLDFFSRFDAVQVIAQSRFEVLSMNVHDGLQSLTDSETYSGEHKQQMVNCLHTDTMSTIITKMVEESSRRVAVVSAHGELKGIITVTDIIKSLVLRPAEEYDDFRSRSFSMTDTPGENVSAYRAMHAIPEH